MPKEPRLGPTLWVGKGALELHDTAWFMHATHVCSAGDQAAGVRLLLFEEYAHLQRPPGTLLKAVAKAPFWRSFGLVVQACSQASCLEPWPQSPLSNMRSFGASRPWLTGAGQAARWQRTGHVWAGIHNHRRAHAAHCRACRVVRRADQAEQEEWPPSRALAPA